uniref:TSA: Wollemia nobilis Ref_Wollemi_Transcript_12440_3188 transcribed RNA sequence n=1 Tax=Wollemia nobilis TaxID=56998 RepID=A0A0C9S839_9CONI
MEQAVQASNPGNTAPAVKFALAKRQGFGKIGRPVTLVANHYRVRFQNKEIFHYDVVIMPEPPKGGHYGVIMETFKNHSDTLKNAIPAYDGHKSLYTTKSFGQLVELDVVLANGEGGELRRRVGKYHITFRQANKINLTNLGQYLAGDPVPLPQEALQVMDVVLRQAALKHFVEKGRSFFGKHFTTQPLDGGLVGYRGFYQSIRPAQHNLLTLNLDIAATPFYPDEGLPDFIGKALRQDVRDLDSTLSRNDSYADAARSRLKKLLKGLRIETTHLKRTYKIKSLTDMPMDVLKFDSNGEQLSVVDYFQKQYNIRLMLRGFPAIEGGNKDRKRYIPIELCRIIKDQPYMKSLNDQQRSGLLNMTCLAPHVRREETGKRGDELRGATRRDAAEFGIEINSLMTELPGRVLPAPKIKYQTQEECPRDGSWNMRGKRIWRGTKITYWSCICFASGVHPQALQTFCQKLPELCGQYGVQMHPQLAAPIANELNGNVEGVVNHQIEACKTKTKQSLELLLCIMPQRENKHLYASVKKLCELDLGIWTQCCLADHVKKCKPEYIANVILKINAKLGGQNSLLVDEEKKNLPLISNVPSLIIGADISHSRVGDDSGPSILSICASMDWPSFSKYEAIVRTQKRGSEIFEDLYWEKEDEQGRKQTGGIFKELLTTFQERVNRKPERILYYRDGVSEGQFEMILNNELGALKKTFEALGWAEQPETGSDEGPSSKRLRLGKSPMVTFIVVQKRHHTRFFPKDGQANGNTLKNGNILPGTVVDSVICQPKLFDFYLCSHAGIKGTSKPAHYNVLKDENGFSPDDIQKLTNDLCFTYVRCTRSVSIVPACYYAHLAAKRARVWIDSESLSESGSYRGGSSHASQGFPGPLIKPLPPIHGRIKNSMFYI